MEKGEIITRVRFDYNEIVKIAKEKARETMNVCLNEDEVSIKHVGIQRQYKEVFHSQDVLEIDLIKNY